MAWMSSPIFSRSFQLTFILATLFFISACTNSDNSSDSEQEQNKSAVQGETVVLSASDVANDSVPTDGSSAIELTFEWTIISRPTNSNAELSDPADPEPTFVADQPGEYVIGLIIRNGTEELLNTTITVVVEPSDSSDPADPTDPSDPTDPTDPVDPAPTDPTDPADPVDPTPADPVKPDNHLPTTNNCLACHASNTWIVTIFDHAEAIGTCFDCHNGTIVYGKNPTHVNTTNNCEACHLVGNDPMYWSIVVGAAFDHDEALGTCASCHNPFTDLPDTHIPITQDCGACHTTDAWSPTAGSDHSSFVGNCVTCHDGLAASGKVSNHINSTDLCDACHEKFPANWRTLLATGVDHTQVIGTCADCHDGVIARGMGDTHFTTTLVCDSCHSTENWTNNLQVDHTGFENNCVTCHFPGYLSSKSDTHINSTDVCDACHEIFPAQWTPVPANQVDHTQVIGTCSSCHALPAGHVETTDECNACHSTTEWTSLVEPQTLWVIDNYTDYISKLNLNDGNIEFQFVAPGGNTSADTSYGLAWDGEFFWTFHVSGDRLYKVDANGVVINYFDFPVRLYGLDFAGETLWGVSGQSLYAINPVDGSYTTIPSPVPSPQAIAFDGVRLWVVGNTSSDPISTIEIDTGTIEYKFDSPDSCPSGLEYYQDQLYILGCRGITIVDPMTGDTVRNIPTNTIRYGTDIAFVSANIGSDNNMPPPTAPVANAGEDRIVMPGSAVSLSGSASYDLNGDSLTYLWEVTYRPPGSTVEIADNTLASFAFTPDVAGSYFISLIVNDGVFDSSPDTVSVTAIAGAACRSNSSCSSGSYCQTNVGACGSEGICTQFPVACLQYVAPVCGCDGVTYYNACGAAEAGVSIAYNGEC